MGTRLQSAGRIRRASGMPPMSIEPVEQTAHRRVSWIWIGLAVSLPLHALLLALLSLFEVPIGVPQARAEAEVEYTLLDLQPLEAAPDATVAGGEVSPEIRPAGEDNNASDPTRFGLPDPTGNDGGEADAVSTGAEGLFSSGGGGGSGGLGEGSGAATTFFGVSGRGRRYGYVVDKSGSMGMQGRMQRAKEEIVRSISALPDFASACITLFDDNFTTLDRERGFLKCRDDTVRQYREWIEKVAQGGGTNPIPAFEFLFTRPERPDVVFFMSDGEIPPDAADEILRLNRRGPNTVIHCIAFGQAAATAPLRRIASETGGTFTVATHGASP